MSSHLTIPHVLFLESKGQRLSAPQEQGLLGSAVCSPQDERFRSPAECSQAQGVADCQQVQGSEEQQEAENKRGARFASRDGDAVHHLHRITIVLQAEIAAGTRLREVPSLHADAAKGAAGGTRQRMPGLCIWPAAGS